MSKRISRLHGAQAKREKLGGHALVIGGSTAGMLAARVLSDHFERGQQFKFGARPKTTGAYPSGRARVADAA